MKHESLIESIQSLYSCSISETETNEAAHNLLGFMELLIEIDREHGITHANQRGVQS